ncbi:MAG: hypothetical protein GF334_00250 [Candidatus Altiarchaeales archaeon]|nr:hypothetical protein [Candidatus Altiarchaeales archaeon]
MIIYGKKYDLPHKIVVFVESDAGLAALIWKDDLTKNPMVTVNFKKNNRQMPATDLVQMQSLTGKVLSLAAINPQNHFKWIQISEHEWDTTVFDVGAITAQDIIESYHLHGGTRLANNAKIALIKATRILDPTMQLKEAKRLVEELFVFDRERPGWCLVKDDQE